MCVRTIVRLSSSTKQKFVPIIKTSNILLGILNHGLRENQKCHAQLLGCLGSTTYGRMEQIFVVSTPFYGVPQ